MNRYIDADKAYEIARKYHKDFSQSIADLTSLCEVLEDTPIADVVSVVRCKDCRCSSDPGDGEVFCEIFESCMPEKGFCSYGERKAEE